MRGLLLICLLGAMYPYTCRIGERNDGGACAAHKKLTPSLKPP